jgi:tRNA-2-methylthio-N6-dimethylallyladenosine synthase
MNVCESDYLAQRLSQSGYVSVTDPREAGVILVNTCAVRAKAEQKAYSMLGRMTDIKKRRPMTILGVVGCVAQKEQSRLMRRFPALDLVMGPREITRISEYLLRIEKHGERVIATDSEAEVLEPVLFNDCRGIDKVTAFLSVMQGCNNFCSYCIVPYVRGRETCRPLSHLLWEAEHLVSNGIREITLLGQNVNAYQCPEKGERRTFVDLLRSLHELEGLQRLRFTTSHPKDLSDDLIQCFSDLPKLCHHIHLPFQAGSNRILEKMRRHYTREAYLRLVDKLRTARPDIALTSDVMVGFPGESDADFESTLDLARRVQFDSLFSFKYSDRKGTVADKMGSKVDESLKSTRLAVLQELQRKTTLKKNKSLEGCELEVLVEGESRRGKQCSGRTKTNKIVNFKYNNRLLGKLVSVKIERAFVHSLWGVLN